MPSPYKMTVDLNVLAQESYAEYLNRSKELDKMEQFLEKLYE